MAKKYKKIYWGDYRKWKDRIDSFHRYIGNRVSDSSNKKIDRLVIETHKKLTELKKEIDKHAEPRLVYETIKETKAEIKKCPWKGNKHISCGSCECRIDLMEKKQRYNSYHPHDHDSLSLLTCSDDR